MRALEGEGMSIGCVLCCGPSLSGTELLYSCSGGTICELYPLEWTPTSPVEEFTFNDLESLSPLVLSSLLFWSFFMLFKHVKDEDENCAIRIRIGREREIDNMVNGTQRMHLRLVLERVVRLVGVL